MNRPWRWRLSRRLLLRIAVAVVLLGLLLRLAAGLLLPGFLERQLAELGFDVSVGRATVVLSSLDVELSHVTLVPSDGAEAPRLALEYLRIDVSVSDLLFGDLVLHRAEVDGLDVVLQRLPDGSLALPDAALRAFAGDGSDPGPAPADDGQAFDLLGQLISPPVIVESLRVQEIQVDWRDDALDPPMHTRADLSVRLSDIGHNERAARLEISLSASDLADRVLIALSRIPQPDALGLDVAVKLNGIRPAGAEGLLAPLGIEALARKLDLELDGRVSLAPSSGGPSFDLSLGPLDVRADGAPALSLQRLAGRVEQGADGDGLVRFGQVELTGLHGQAGLEADGAFTVAGLRIEPPPSSEPAPDDEPGAPLHMELDRAAVSDVELTLLDGTTSPATPLTLSVVSLEVQDATTNLGASTPPTLVALELAAPGLLESLQLDASLDPEGDHGDAVLTLEVQGIDPVALEPRLRSLGIASRVSGGTLSAAVESGWRRTDAGLMFNGRLHDVALDDGVDVTRLDELEWSDVELASDGSRIDVGELVLRGLLAEVVLQQDGLLRLPAVDLLPVAPLVGPAVEGPAAPVVAGGAVDAPASGPFVRVGTMRLEDEQLAFTLPGRPRTQISDLDLELTGIGLPPGGLPTVDRLALETSLAGIVDRVELSARITPNDDGVQAQASLSARGLHTADLIATERGEPQLDFDGGSVSLDLTANVTGSLAQPRIDLELTDLVLLHLGQEVFGLDALRVVGLATGADGLAVERVSLASPRALVERKADGSLSLPGLRLPVVAAVVGQPAVAPAPPLAAPPPAPPLTDAGLAPVRVGRLAVDGLLLSLTDLAMDPPVTERLRFDLGLDGLVLGPDVAPTQVELSLEGDSAGRVSLRGPVTPSVERPAASLTLEGRALDLSVLATYLPPGIVTTYNDGRLDGLISLDVVPVPEGGRRVEASIEGFTLGEGQAAPQLAWERLGVTAGRLDAEAGVYEFEELAFTGLQVDAGMGPDGELLLPGVTLVPGPKEDAPPAAPATPAPRYMATTRRDLPRIGLERLDIRFDALTWNGADRTPLTLRDFGLSNANPLTVDGDERPDVVGLHLEGSLAPVVDRLDVKFSSTPFDPQPAFTVDVAVSGIHGPALHEAVPELEDVLDARGLADGELGLTLMAIWTSRRRHTLDFDTSAGVGFDVALVDLKLVDHDDERLLVGLESLELEIRRALGSKGALIIDSLEVAEPLVRLRKTERGLEVADVILLGDKVKRPPDPLKVAAGPPPVGPERTIRRLLVAGADVIYRDATVTPPLDLPVVGLDVEARNLSTLAFDEEQPISFNVMAQGGVPGDEMPWSDRERAATAHDGEPIPEAQANPEAEATLDARTSHRPVFEEIQFDGRLFLFPRLAGRVRTELQAFDLEAIKGPAASQGIILRKGLVDARADLVFQDDGALAIDSRTRVTDLDLSEPAGGPIQSVLRLPSPTGSIIFLLRNENGLIDLPLEFSVPTEGLSVAAVSRVAVSALGGLIARAVANAPFRVVGGLTDTVGGLTNSMGGLIGVDLGLGGETEARDAGPTVRLSFDVGGADLRPEGEALLDELCDRLEDDAELRLTLRHRIGTQDMALLFQRANPPAGWAEELALRMRVRRGSLELERGAVAERLRALIVSGLYERATGPTEDLARLDVEIGLLERSLDALLEVMRPGSKRLEERRARAMASSVAQLRLSELAAALRRRLGSDGVDRVRVLAPRVSRKPAEPLGLIEVTPSFRRSR